MYPYYLVERDEETEAARSRFWFPDRVHWSKPLYPFDSITVEATFLSVGVYSTRLLALPPALGIDARLVNGYLYLSPTPVEDPAEIERRTAEFEQRAGYYFANWDELVGRWQEKAEQLIAEMGAIDFAPLPTDLEPRERVLEARGSSVGYEVLRDYERLISLFFLIWQYHFEMVTLGYGAFGTFFGFCKQVFPDIGDEAVSRMVSGIDVLAFRPDEELKGLARRAIELEVTEAFSGDRSPAEVIADLEQRTGGQQWLAALDQAKQPWFNFSTGYGFYHDETSWIHDLAFPFAGIRGYIQQLRDGKEIERDLPLVRAERDRLIDEHRSVLGEAEQAQFDQLLGLAQTVFPHIEDHNFHVEHWSHTIFWQKLRDLGGLLVEAGFLAEVDDLFFINRHELGAVLFDVVEAWAIGVRPAGVRHWRAKIASRREIYSALEEWSPPPALGVPPTAVTDPFAIMNYGITTERLQEWLGGGAVDGNGSGPLLTGAPGSAGVAEGLVRVIASERQLGEVQPGEILVCPITAPSWTPLLGEIAGIVSDSGGMMCHAAIVCREFGVPAVVGTGFATSRLETGQRVRIDGSVGTVELIS
jgi:pyruvate,water dikinase